MHGLSSVREGFRPTPPPDMPGLGRSMAGDSWLRGGGVGDAHSGEPSFW